MKRVSFILLLVLLASCGSSIQTRDGKIVECYGLMDQHKVKVDGIRYDTSIANVIWGVILVETIVVPVWLFGYKLYCPEEGQ